MRKGDFVVADEARIVILPPEHKDVNVRKVAEIRDAELDQAWRATRPRTLTMMRAAVSAPRPATSRSGTNSTRSNAAIRALAAIPCRMPDRLPVGETAGRGSDDPRHDRRDRARRNRA